MTDSRRDRAYWERLDWVSDAPGRTSSRWKSRPLPKEGDTRPPWAPNYEVGDLLVIALTGDDAGRCPAIVRVEQEPRWEPDFADRHGGPNDGDRWGVVTRVRKVHVLDPHDGPTLSEIDVDPASTRRRGYLTLSQHQYELAERLIAQREPSTPAPATRRPEFIPVEDMSVEGYDVKPPEGLREATRREQKLVRDYVAYLGRTGQASARQDIGRYKIPVAGGTSSIYADIFNASRNQLIEAKADSLRGSVRMAIGQLADYAHHLDSNPQPAVLLPEPPTQELRELLNSQGIAIVWRDSHGFSDDADGAFT